MLSPDGPYGPPNPLCRRLLLFLPSYSALLLFSDPKQYLSERIIQYFDVMLCGKDVVLEEI